MTLSDQEHPIMMSEEVIEAVARDFFEAALNHPAQDLDRLWRMQLDHFREMSATYPEYVHYRSLTTDAFRNARLAIRSVTAALQSHSQGNAGEVTDTCCDCGRLLGDSFRGSVSGKAWHHWCNAPEASVPPPVMVDEVERLREALREIMELPGEINPSNYDHDDVCELNRQFCYAYETAKAALNGGANVR